jgi:hypothetical protein
MSKNACGASRQVVRDVNNDNAVIILCPQVAKRPLIYLILHRRTIDALCKAGKVEVS